MKKKKGAAKAAKAKASETTMSTEIKTVEVAKIIPMASNRKVNMRSAKMADLIESVKAHGGNLVPGIGRPHPDKPGYIELASGARRLHALRAAGLDSMNMTVSEISDADMVTIRCTENSGREDLTPMEEARDVADMLAVHGTVAAVADKLGKPARWVARRARLASLIPAWRTLLEAEDVTAGIGQLELIAAMPEETQTQLFELLRSSTYMLEPSRLDQFRRWLADSGVTNQLNVAPWKLDDDALLPKAGACSLCPKRSSCSPELFTAEDFGDQMQTRGKKAAAADRCLDGECWRAKLETYTAQRVASVMAKHPQAIRVATFNEYAEYNKARELRKAGVIFSDDAGVTKAKKSDERALPAVVVAGPNVGEVIYLAIAKDSPAAETTGQAGAAGGGDDRETLDDKRAALERRRWAWVATHVRETLEVCACPAEFVGPDAARVMVGYCVAFGTMGPASRYVDMENDGSLFDLAHAQAEAEIENLGKLLFGQLKPEIMKAITCRGTVEVTPDFVANVRGAAMMLGLEPDALKRDADAEIPEPKSWAKLGDESI